MTFYQTFRKSYRFSVEKSQWLWGFSFSRFLLVGGINTVFGYGVFCAVQYSLDIPSLSVLVSLVAGVTFNFFTTGRIVFQNANPSASHLLKFLAMYAGTFLLNIALLNGLLMVFSNVYLLQFIVQLSIVLVTFTVSKYWVFTKKKAH